jgi:hypothetical protein
VIGKFRKRLLAIYKGWRMRKVFKSANGGTFKKEINWLLAKEAKQNNYLKM